MMKTQKKQEKIHNFADKRCPECFTRLPLASTRCPNCQLKVGPVNKYGLARTRPNWIAYGVSILSIAALVLYVRWAFFS